MKNLTILAITILFSSCFTASAFDPFRDEEVPWWQPHCYYPKPHSIGKALPPLPASHFHPAPFHPPPVVAKCLADCKDMRTCLTDLAKAFFTKKLSTMKSDCCDSIHKMDESCEKTVFGPYQNPFFNCFVKLHCSTKAKTTPSAPSTPSPKTPTPSTPSPKTPATPSPKTPATPSPKTPSPPSPK